DNDSQDGTAETLYASTDKPAQSDPLGPLHKELRILNTKIDKLESSMFSPLCLRLLLILSEKLCLVYSHRL
ncbi:hypothetical protein Tco_0618941, partial [Tanacetum coccineum]